MTGVKMRTSQHHFRLRKGDLAHFTPWKRVDLLVQGVSLEIDAQLAATESVVTYLYYEHVAPQLDTACLTRESDGYLLGPIIALESCSTSLLVVKCKWRRASR